MDMKFYESTITEGYYRYKVTVELEFFGDGHEQTRSYIEHLAHTELEEGAREHFLDLKIDKQPIDVHGMKETDSLPGYNAEAEDDIKATTAPSEPLTEGES